MSLLDILSYEDILLVFAEEEHEESKKEESLEEVEA